MDIDMDMDMDMDERAVRLRKSLFYYTLIAGAVVGIGLSWIIDVYDYDWTADIPDRVDSDAVGAALIIGIFGIVFAVSSLIYKRSGSALPISAALVLVGAIRVAWLSVL